MKENVEKAIDSLLDDYLEEFRTESPAVYIREPERHIRIQRAYEKDYTQSKN